MGSPVIEVVHLAKSYGTIRAVADVSLTVAAGEIFGVLGPNGAGKTTTVECLSGLRSPDSGSVRVLGIDPLRDPAAVRQVLGVQLQESRLPGKLRVLEALRLYAAFYTQPADPEELLALLGLTDRRDTSYRDLSGGQKQRLSIALALVGQPRVAILDELTTGLDPQARRETWGLIERVRDSGVTVLLVTHFMDEAERLCDRLVVIDRGQVVAQGSPAELTGDDGGQRTFRMRLPGGSLPGTGLLTTLPEVTVAREVDDLLEVTGTATVLPAVLIALHDRGIVPDEVRTVGRSLEDAFVDLVARNQQEETQR